MPAHRTSALLALVLTGAAVALEPVDRRSREQPEVGPRAGDGRHGSCDVLRFTPAGDTLFAAGDDKVVTGWRHSTGGLETEPAKAEVLRWPAWREQLGGIKACDISPDGKRVVVGGFGLRPSSVAVLERGGAGGTAKQLLTWPYAPPDALSPGVVTTVAFSNDGKAVAFGTKFGGLWLWHPEELPKADAAGRFCSKPKWVGTNVVQATVPGRKELVEKADRPILVFFGKTDDRLLAVYQSGAVIEYAVGDPAGLDFEQGKKPARATPIGNVNDEDKPAGRPVIFAATYDRPRDRLVVANDDNRVVIRPLDGKSKPTVVTLPQEHFARSVAVHPVTGAVAVAVGTSVRARDGRPQFHNDADDELRVYADPAARPTPDQSIPLRGQADALAFHPTLPRLAVAGGDANEVTLYGLTATGWAGTRFGLVPARIGYSPLTVARGSGRRVWELALAADGSAVGMRTNRNPTADQPNGRGAGDWQWMNLTKLIPAAAPKRVAESAATADGWSIVPDKQNRDRWYAAHADGSKRALLIDAAAFNKPTCFVFLKATETAPTRLIVGHFYGASLFVLPKGPATTNPLAPARVYVGHSGEVLSVAAVDDAKGGWFVSGGADHTVAAFHLGDWQHNPNLGASFAAAGKPSELVVEAVAVGSPAWEAGLQPGNVVTMLAVGGETVYDTRPARTGPAPDAEASPFESDERGPNDPELKSAEHLAEARAALAAAVPLRQLYFRVRADGKTSRDLSTSVKQRPLWKLYQTFAADGRPADWVAWMWQRSYYHTTSTNGDALVGWHLNGPAANVPPRFHLFGHYRGYQRDQLLLDLIRDRDVRAALDTVAKAPDRPKSVGEAEPPKVTVTVSDLEVTDKPVTVRVSVERGAAVEDLMPVRVELWLNDYRVKVWRPDPLAPAVAEQLDLDPALFRRDDRSVVPSRDNVLTVRTFNRAGGRQVASEFVTSGRTELPPPRLYGLAVGVNDYGAHRLASGARGLVSDLKYPVADAELVARSFAAHVGAGRFFAAGQLGVRTDAQVGRDRLLASLKALQADPKPNPNDTLVLFLAGHGQLIGRKGDKEEVVSDKETDPARAYDAVRFAFCCPNFDTGKPGEAVVTAEELFEELAGINCRKIVVLDVCRAGWATRTDVIRQLIPDGVGPFVLAACGPGQVSHELDELKQGLFTAAVAAAVTARGPTAAFNVADTDRDGRLSCQELFDYVHRRVTEAKPDQTPTCFPDRAHLPRASVLAIRRQ